MTLTIDTIKSAMKLLAEIPPCPLFVSSNLFSSETALTFTWNGRYFVGAHALFWAKIPVDPFFKTNSLSSIPIVNVDLVCNERERMEFLSAMNSIALANTTVVRRTPILPWPGA